MHEKVYKKVCLHPTKDTVFLCLTHDMCYLSDEDNLQFMNIVSDP